MGMIDPDIPVWGLFQIDSSYLSKIITDFYPDSFVENKIWNRMIRIHFFNFIFYGS